MLSDAPPSSHPESGIIDGRYQLRRVLARGGCARVYAAEHVFTHRMVALKLAHAGSSAYSARRARREVEILSRVQGPGIVELLDAGQAGGEPYMALELLEGRTLAGLLAARGRLAVNETLKVGIEVANALARCHDKAVLHRDIKPSNLFTTVDDRVAILDFGIAKLMQPSDDWHEKITSENAMPGTPEYMAPEALLGGQMDARADQYALGVTLYECLTGTVPFDGKHGEILLKQSIGSPRPLRELRPDVPEPFAAIVDRCLSRAAADRFESTRALAAALQSCLSTKADDISLLWRGPRGDRPRTGDRDKTTLAAVPTAKQKPENAASRRKHPRVPYSALARIRCADGSVIDGRVEEVSEGGLQFIGAGTVVVGQTANIRFALPASGLVTEVDATARWNRSMRGNNAIGFEFTSIADSARREIAKYAEIMRAD
jgi:serine/threonine-protein kinase